jgi:aspartyl-tRNA(Asn)/glutamyl-tRNA(Gln) amidotransferase subunit A
MRLEDARRRIRERSELHAFISVSDETGEGQVVGVKDLIDVAGMVTTAGGIILPQLAAAADAPVVARLREGGCVIAGKTNLHEFAYGVTSINPHYGDVLNPHDSTRVAGGSSGGSAVAVACAMCDWAIGTDTGGSIRIPASLCGIVGFKPQIGTIDTTGVFPLSRSLDTVGPMAASVAEVAAAFDLMTGETTAIDAEHRPRLAAPRGWVRDLDEGTARAWETVSRGLPEIDFLEHARLFEVGLTVLLYEAAQVHGRWASEQPQKYGADVLAHVQRGLAVPRDEYDRATASLAELRASADEALAEVDALLLPASAIVAPRVSAGNEVREPMARFTRPFNTTGQPVVALPAPSRGLPVGIQVVARTNAGALSAAAWLEREWRGLGA